MSKCKVGDDTMSMCKVGDDTSMCKAAYDTMSMLCDGTISICMHDNDTICIFHS